MAVATALSYDVIEVLSNIPLHRLLKNDRT